MFLCFGINLNHQCILANATSNFSCFCDFDGVLSFEFLIVVCDSCGLELVMVFCDFDGVLSFEFVILGCDSSGLELVRVG